MFVFRDGRTAGSIGGGKVEFEAGKHAVNVHTTETRVYELGPVSYTHLSYAP